MGYNNTGEFTTGKCLKEVLKLGKTGAGIAAAKKRSKLGYLEAVNSPLNTSGQTQLPVQNGSKKRFVEIVWRQRTIESQIFTDPSGNCTTDDFDDFNSEMFEVDKYVERKFGLNMAQFKEVCEGRGNFIQDSLELSYNALAKTINKAILAEQVTELGINLRTGLSSATDVTVFPEATGAPQARALQKLQSDFEVTNEMSGTPMWIGAGNIYEYWKTLEQACCNDAGVNMLDLSNSLGYAPFTDTTMKDVLNANEFIVMEQGAAQFVTFNDYVGEDATSAGSSVARGTIKDAKTGIVYDIKIMQDDCKDNWTVIVKLHYGIWFQPLAAYQVDDELHGTRGTLLYRAVAS